MRKLSLPLWLCAGAIGLGACGEKAPPAAAPAAPTVVKALKVGAGGTALAGAAANMGTADETRYSGEVRARVETTLGFRVGGKIVERRVDAGTRVQAGQPLARLDPTDAQLAAAQAEANRQLAAADLRRTRELREKNFVSQAALDAKATAATAAEAQARLARNQTAYTALTADAPGVIVAVLAEPGQVVAPGQGVFRLARDGAREVAIAIPESRVAGLKIGDAATVELWAGRRYQGALRELAPMADPATRTFAARVAIADADAAVALGMTATVRFVQAGKDRVVVPLAALLQQGEKATVWVIGTAGAVTRRAVEIERYTDAGAVVTAGLEAGETIVAAGAFRLTEGEKVRVAQ